MSSLKIRLFGKFSLMQDDREEECIQSAKAKELFCYLLLHRNRFHSREILASLLWADYTTAQSKKCLRQTLWQLQQDLHNLLPNAQNSPLQVDGEYLQLDPNVEMWLDVDLLERAFGSVRSVAGENMDENQAQLLRDAVSFYCGDLLEGWFQDWCIYHRERLQSMHLAMLDKLMAYCEIHQDYENGLSFGQRLLLQDNAREKTYYRLMRLYYLAGDRAGALRQFHRCEAALQADLGVKPAKRTLELYEQIRSDKLDVCPFAQPEAERQSAGVVPRAFLSRLRTLRGVLSTLQQRLKRDIDELDRALHANVGRPRSERDLTR